MMDATDSEVRAIAVVGPTASGKASLGREVARRLSTPLLVCDSVKVYRRLDIGSAKPSAAARASVEHRMIDLVDPDASFSAGDYATAAWTQLRAADGRGLFVGGTGFYLRAVAVRPTTAPPEADVPADDPRRLAFDGDWTAVEAADPGALHRALSAADPVTAGGIHPHNFLRALRALWLCEVCGAPISRIRAGDPPRPRLRLLVVVLDPGVGPVDARIDARVEQMLSSGWLAEVEKLVADGYDGRFKSMQSLGYRQMLEVAAGHASLDEARHRIAAATRQYARRQRTFFRRQLPAVETIALTDAAECPHERLAAFWKGRP
jgi:tRNA dimethylallyltransferase